LYFKQLKTLHNYTETRENAIRFLFWCNPRPLPSSPRLLIEINEGVVRLTSLLIIIAISIIRVVDVQKPDQALA